MPKEESKAAESDLLQRAIKYCWGDGFLNVFRAYFRKHAHHFLDTAEEKTEEHSLVYQELFQEYLALFEGTLEEYIEREGATQEEFYAAIRDNQDSRDPGIKLFVTCLLASADYDSFFKVMVKEAKRQLDAKEQTAGDSKTGDNDDQWQEDTVDSSSSSSRKQKGGDDHEESKSSCGDKRK